MEEFCLKEIVVFGSGGHAGVIIDLIESHTSYRIRGLIDATRKTGEIIYGYKVIPIESIIGDKEVYGIIAIGDNWIRYSISELIKMQIPDFKFISLIHPTAIISQKAVIGEGSLVLAGAIIQTNCKVGAHSIINTKSSVDHDCKLGNFVSVAPGATLGGKVEVGDFSIISLGANVIHSVKIGEHSLIGAGSTVIKNIPSYKIAYGVPARIIRDRNEGEKYL